MLLDADTGLVLARELLLQTGQGTFTDPQAYAWREDCQRSSRSGTSDAPGSAPSVNDDVFNDDGQLTTYTTSGDFSSEWTCTSTRA